MGNNHSEHGLARQAARWVDFVQRRPRTTLAVSLLTAALSLWYALATLHFSTQRTDLLSPDHPVLRDYNRLRNEFDRESDMIVVAAGESPEAIIRVLAQVAERLRGRPDLFEKVLDRIDVSGLRRKGLFQLSIDQLRELERGVGPLALATSPPFSWVFMLMDWEPVSVEGMLQARSKADETTRLALLRSLEDFLRSRRDYKSPFADLVADVAPEAAAFDDPRTKGYIFSPDKRLALLRVLPVRDATSFVGLGAPVAELRRIVGEVSTQNSSVEVGLTGLPILEDDEMQTAMSSGVWAAALEFGGVMLVFFVGFRAFRHPMLIQLALAIAGCWTLGMVAVTVGRLNILSTAFIMTLIGMGVDFGVVWLTRFESARAVGSDALESNRQTGAEIGPGVISGAVTTTVAFYATMVTDFVGLRDMGWIAGTGILVCLFSMLTVLPATLALWSRSRPIAAKRGRRDLEPAFGWVKQRPRATLAVGGMLAVLLSAPLPWLKGDYNLLHLQATGLPSVEWEHRLIREMKASGWYAQLSVGSPDEARRVKKALERLPQVGRIVDAATLTPADQLQKQPIVARIHRSLEWMPGVLGSSSVRPDALLKTLRRMEAANDDASEAARRVLSVAAMLRPNEFAERLDGFQGAWRQDLSRRLAEMKSASTPEPVATADLPPTLLERYRGKSGRWLLHVFPKGEAWDFEPLEAFVNAVRSIDPHATGEPMTSVLGVVELVHGFKTASWLSLFAVFVCCWIDLRSFWLSVLAMGPLVVGCGAAFGIMAFLGLTINPANMIALPLILGLGVDFGVHVLHDYARAPTGYFLNWRLARALVLTTLTTMVGFSSLLISGHWGMTSIGILLSLGVACCSAAALLLLPAVLQLTSADRPPESQATPAPVRAIQTRIRQAA